MTSEEFWEWLIADDLLRELPLAAPGWRPPHWTITDDGKGPRLVIATALRDPVMHRELLITAWLQ